MTDKGKGQHLYEKAKGIIPGGTQLLSKRPEMFLPRYWPAYYSRAKGCEIWDLDNNRYIDMSLMGIGSCILGYADEDVNRAVIDAVGRGSMSTLNSPEEVELANLLLELHPWANMVRYARTGGEAMTVAVRIARAQSGRDKILLCGYHGWHDWYLCANLGSSQALDGVHLPGLEPKGVPRALKDTTFTFQFNDTVAFLDLIGRHGKEVGAVVMEPMRDAYPDQLFIQVIREKTKELGIALIVDEITAAWRENLGGAHLSVDLDPDIAVFAKGMSNGFPMAAVIGKKDVMDYAQESFISSTYWTERIGPIAAIATIGKMQEKNIQSHLVKIGNRVKQIWKAHANKFEIKVDIGGIDPLAHFSFLYDDSLVLKTLFTQCMLEEGFLATTAFYASYAHKAEYLEDYERSLISAFKIIASALKEGNPKKYLKGECCDAGFRRLA